MTKPRSTNPDEVLDVAAELFAAKPFHEVRLEDIAAKAHVGKGTVYLYWSSKEDVYLAVIRRGFAAVLERVDAELDAGPATAWDRIVAIVDALTDFAFAYPGVYQLMRRGTLTPEDPDLQRVRGELVRRIVSTIRDGVARGELQDPCPSLTAQYLLSFVRGALLYPPSNLTKKSLRNHILHILGGGLTGRRTP